MATPKQLYSFPAPPLPKKLSNNCRSSCSSTPQIHRWMTTILLTLLQRVHYHEKRYWDLEGNILPNFPDLIATWLYAVFWLKGYLVWLPLGSEEATGGGESFGFFCFPRGKVVAKATHCDGRGGQNQEFLVLGRGVICGGRGRGCARYLLWARGWSECRRRQGQTTKCIATLHTNQIQFRKVLSVQN